MNASKLQQKIRDLKDQLKSCMNDLATMPRCKAGTEWHTDRVREAQWLVAVIERTEGALKAQALLN